MTDERNRLRVFRWVDAEDRRFLTVLDSDLAAGTQTAGPHLACRIGCTECCTGSFPITQLDARRLRLGWATLRETDPGRAWAVLARAERKLADGDVEGPCAALDPATGACDLYAARPVTCRTFGLPVRIGRDDLPPCRLCFTEATPADVEAARVTIDPDGDEQAMIGALTELGIEDETTTVAEAIVAVRKQPS